jgi:YebC/PmpR family DNA-binding regulatory protein
MSGHSKWAGIKHKKAIVDAKRGQAFTRASREILISAKEGGGNVEGNFRLRLAVQKAREINMPTDKIQNAIKRGTGELAGEKLEEIRYEGYGPAGVAVMVDAFTESVLQVRREPGRVQLGRLDVRAEGGHLCRRGQERP